MGWSDGGGGSGGGGWSSGTPSSTAGRSGGGGWNFNPFHDIAKAYSGLNPVGGIQQLASGITKTFVHPFYGAAEAVGQLGAGAFEKYALGQTERGNADIQSAGGTALDVLQKGLLGGTTGLAQAFTNLGSDIATPIGLGGQYNKVAGAPFHALAGAMGEKNLGSETYHQLNDFVPSTAQARGRKEGFFGAYLGDALIGSDIAGRGAKIAGKIGDFQAGGDAGAAVAESGAVGADVGAVADATAEGVHAAGSTAYKVRDALHTTSEALNPLPRGAKAAKSSGSFIGLKTADLVRAIHEAVYPGDVQPSETGGVSEGTTHPVIDQQVADYNAAHGLEAPVTVDTSAQIDPELGARRGDWYKHAESDPNAPDVKASYAALADSVKQQWKYMTEKLGVKVIADNGDIGPGRTYETPAAMKADVETNKTLHVTPTGADEAHPQPEMNQVAGKDANGKPLTVNDMFRAVHDYFGHSRAGNDVGPNGEDIAYQLHQQMFPPEAHGALATETAGQNGYLNFSEENMARKAAGLPGEFGPQKSAIMPAELRGQSPAEMAAARATLHPVDAAAEAMAGNEEATRGTTSDTKVKVPKTRADEGPTPAGDENAQAIDERVRAAREAARPTFVEDRQGQRMQMPAPAWAVRVAEFLPDSVNRVLAHLNTPMTWIRLRTLANDYGHYMEISQNRARSNPLHLAAERAVADLIGEQPGLTRDQLTHMVGEEASYRIDGGAMVAEFVRSEGKVADAEVEAAIMKRAKRGYVGIPDAIWNAMDPAVHTSVDTALSDMVDAYKVDVSAQLETLLASRYGAQGIERALVPEGELPMTPELTRLYRRAMSDLARERVLRERDVLERAKRQAELTKAVLFAGKAGDDVAAAQEALGVNEATIESLHDPVPKGVKNAETTAQRLIEYTLENGGASWNVGEGVARVAEGFIVGLAHQFTVPLTEFTQRGVQLLVGAIRSPVDTAGGLYDSSALWSGPDAVLGTWVHTGPDGVPVVTVDVGVASNGGAALDELGARMLGEAYAQEAIFNPATGEDVVLSKDPTIQNVASFYVKDALDPKSDLHRVLDELALARKDGSLNITAEEQNAALQHFMTVDHQLAAFLPDQWSHGDTFNQMEVKYGQIKPGDAPHFQQTVMRMTADQLVDFAMRSQNHAKISSALRWYYDSHNFIEAAWRGKQFPIPDVNGNFRDAADVFYDVLAVTSVMASPMQNLGRALMSFANLDEFLQGQKDGLAAAHSVMERAMANEPAATTKVENLGGVDKTGAPAAERQGVREGTSVAYRWLNTPEFRALTERTSMTTVPKYNVIDILLGRLNLETATAADISRQSADWTGKPRGGPSGFSEQNFPRGRVVEMADTLGLHGPGVQAYQEWVGRGDALHQLGILVKEMKAQGLGTKETIAKALGEQGFKTQADLARAIKAHRAEEAALRADPEVTQAAEQALMEHHGSNALAKLRSFRDNLAHPETSLMVTLDSIMAQGFGLSKTDFGKGGKYAEFANMVRETAARLGKEWGRPVMPHEVQALIWVTIKDYIGKQDWGRLLAHHDIAQADLTAIEKAVSEGGHVDAKTFQPFRDYWNEENGLTTENQANVGERTWLKDEAKKRRLDPEEQDNLDYLTHEWVPRQETIVHTTPDRVIGEGDQGWMDANQTAETRIHIADDAKVWKEKMRQNGLYLDKQRQWQADIAAGEFDKVRREMTSWLNQRRDSILGDVEGEAFGPGMVKEGSSSEAAIARLRTSRYVPQPSADALHSSAEGLMQQIHEDIKGITMADPGPTGRYLIKLFKTADLSTLLHEHAHLIRQILPPDLMDLMRQEYPGIEGRFESNKQVALPERLRAEGRRLVNVPPSRGGNLNIQRVNAEEAFVADLMRYMQDKVRGGTVPPAHELLFNRIASLLEETHATFLNTPEGRAVPNDIAAFWDRIFNPEIVRADAVHDPLSAQYVRPTPGLNVRRFAWESDAKYAERVRQFGEARGARGELQLREQQAIARAKRADAAVEKMQAAISSPTPSSLAADALHTRAMADLGKIDTAMDHPTRAQLPQQWRNFMEALDGVRETAKADHTGGTAELLDEIPETFTQVMQFAAERGFEPQYIPDMTWKMATRYMMGHLQLDGKSDPDAMRKVNEGVLSRMQMADRSVEALGAGMVKATRELYRGRLVDFIERYHAKILPAGEAIPEGWTTWSPERQAIITGRSTVGKGEVAIGEQLIVPKEVSRALDAMRQPYEHWSFRMLMKGTQPWKTLILTLSPSWYIKHFMGAMFLATAEGVKPQDWRVAWRQFKTDTLPDVVRGRSIFTTLEDETGRGKSTFKRKTFGEGGTLSAEGKKAAYKQVEQRMRGIVKTVDGLGRAAVYAKTIREGGSYEFAVNRVYESLGDFGNLTPFERSAVQAVIPFYAFQKAMIRVLMRVAGDHPLATGVLMQLGRMHNAYMEEKLGGLPHGLLGAGIIGGDKHPQLIGYQKLNPLTDSWNVLTPEGLASSLNPAIQLFTRQAFHYQSFNDTAGMGSYGQLIPQQDVGANILDLFTSSPVGSIFGGGKGFNNFNPAKVYTPKQIAALKRRIAKTITAEQLVNQKGGYLATDANPPAKTG